MKKKISRQLDSEIYKSSEEVLKIHNLYSLNVITTSTYLMHLALQISRSRGDCPPKSRKGKKSIEDLNSGLPLRSRATEQRER